MQFNQAGFYGRCGAVAGAIALLVSCGGGGDGGGGTFLPLVPPEVPVPEQPVVQVPEQPVAPVEKRMVSGTVTGLVGTLVLQNNAGDDLQVTADGQFSFASGVAIGSEYAVSVRTQPYWQVCAVTKGSGTIKADVADVAIACAKGVPGVSTFAGGTRGLVDANGTAARLDDPFGIVINKKGELFVTENGNNRVRRISANGDVTVFAGNSTKASVNGNGANASFNNVTGIGLAPSGDLYVTEFIGNKIRKISPTADVTDFAGSGVAGSDDANGTSATFSGPISMVVDGAGNTYVVELNAALIRKISPAGDVITLVGSGTGSFLRPYGIAVDADGNLFVADSGNHRIRKLTPAGVVSTFAGSDAGVVGSVNGPGVGATFDTPGGLAFDALGNLYVADTNNDLVRKITPDGVVSTVAGQAHVQGAQNGIGEAATFNQPYGLAIGADGSIYVADSVNHRIRKITPVAAP
jgi:streptogramin lyase